MKERDWMVGIALVVALAAGLGAGYLLWGWPTNWYARDVTSLPASPENDIIRYGHSLIVDTSKHIGKAASDPQKRYAGNDLACVNCHLDAGLRPFAAPFVSTFATFPMLVDDQVITLKERINGCMLRSMNGKELPKDSPEMEALIVYIKFLGQGTPQGVRVAGMGLFPLPDPPLAADGVRGEKVYADLCASCHKEDGQGDRNKPPRLGYSIPPLWGDDSFNAAAGMAKLAYAAAYIRACYPGLALRVSVGGRKSWNYVYRFAGKPRRMTLDAFPAMGVQQAHDAWRIAREQVRAGRDPGKPAPAEPATDFASVFREWIAKDQAGNHSRRDVEKRMQRELLELWGPRKIDSIGKRDILDAVDRVLERGQMIKCTDARRKLIGSADGGRLERNDHAIDVGFELGRVPINRGWQAAVG